MSHQHVKALDGIQACTARAMSDWHMPSLAIAAGHVTEPVLPETFGRCDKAAILPVTTDTLFPACSP